MSAMEIVVNAVDNASPVIRGVGESAEEAGSKFEVSWGQVTAAGAAAGAAAEGFARSQQDSNAILSRAAIATGESEDALRDSISAMSDHTLSSHDAAEGMEELLRRGIDTKEGFEDVLPVMDTFSDATGRDMVGAIGEVDQVLGALGIPLDDAGDHIDQFTRLMTETDVPMGTLQRNLSRVPDELQDLEFGMEDAAAGIEVFRDRGFDGREAVREFRRSVEESEGDMDTLLDNLGLTAEEFGEYQQQVGEAEGMTEQFAEANNETMTPLQRLQQNVENLMFEYGGLADAAGILAPILIGLGPVIKGLTLVFRMFNLTLLMNPIFLIVAAVAALIAIGVLLWKNWDTVVEFFEKAWEWIKEAFSAAVDFIVDLVVGFFDFYIGIWKNLWETVLDALRAAWNWIEGRFQDGRDLVVRVVQALRDRVVGAWNDLRDKIDSAVERIRGFLSGIWDGVTDGAKTALNNAIGLINSAISGINSLIDGANRLPGVSIPNVPEIPRLHDGGVFRTTSSSGEGLAMLRDQERVRTPEQEDQLLGLLRRMADRQGSIVLENHIEVGGEVVRVVRSEIRADKRDTVRRVGAGSGRSR